MPDDTGVIFRIDHQDTNGSEDKPSQSSNNTDVLNRYYAYVIRNIFGLGFEPIIKALEISENGPEINDEISLVNLGLNWGWYIIKGSISNKLNDTKALVSLPSSVYTDPLLSTTKPIGLTGIEFIISCELGNHYLSNFSAEDFSQGYWIASRITVSNICLLPLQNKKELQS